jgi:hypothetical protein
MADAYHRFHKLPPSVQWAATPARPFEHLPAGWPTTDRTDRVLTYSASDRVLVCLPPLSIPSTEDNASLFGHLRLPVQDVSVDTVATLLEATATHLDPVGGPENCWYGVKVGGIQTFGTTPERFCRDLRTITEWLDDDDRPQRREATVSTQHVLGSALWPVEAGWVSLTYRRNREIGSESLEFDLLSPGLRTDTDPVTAVFETVDESGPTVQRLWPERCLSIQRRQHTALVKNGRSEAVSNRAVTHGTNPLYRSSPDELFDERPPNALLDPLVQTSTLLYHGTTGGEACVPGFRELIAVEPPGRSSLWVTAKTRPVVPDS